VRVQLDSSGLWEWDEYALPCEITDLPSTKGLTPWMKRWIDLGPDEVLRALSMECASIRDPRAARFRDVLLEFRPFALAHDEERWYLRLNCRNDDGTRQGTVYIESPLDPAILEKCLADHDLGGHELMREFYSQFHGVRYQPFLSGNFERPEEWKPLRALDWDEDEFGSEYISVLREWFDALILYTTLGGDMVIRTPCPSSSDKLPAVP
jgi:hypothetical protein